MGPSRRAPGMDMDVAERCFQFGYTSVPHAELVVGKNGTLHKTAPSSSARSSDAQAAGGSVATWSGVHARRFH